jgi:glutathione S-transferase
MQLYFSPMACSMATRIALYEAGVAAELVEVDPRTKLTPAGDDFLRINPLGLVPTLRTDDGEVLTENAAILQLVADRHPAAALAPPIDARARLHEWLSFIGTELHKAVFVPLLDARAPADAKSYALSKAASRLDHVARHLAEREYLLERFSVADGYLFTVLSWTVVTPIDLSQWPPLTAYIARLRARPSVGRALREELALYAAEQARHAAT